MRIIDSHAHIVQYIAGTGAEGELRSVGDGYAVYATGKNVRMIPECFHSDHVTAEQLLQVMDENGVEKAVLLQGNFYGFQNVYTAEAAARYPGRLRGAGMYDPFSRQKEDIRSYLFGENGLHFMIEKFECSTGSGLMGVHPSLRLDGEVMDEALSYANRMHHVTVVDMGKCGSPSWQVEAAVREVKRYPDMKFVFCHLLAPSDRDEDQLKYALEKLQLPNVWFDLSSVPHNVQPDIYPYPKALHYIALARDIVGAEHLLWGTDFPSCLKEDSYEHFIRYILEAQCLDAGEKEMIMHRNAEKVYFSH